MAASPSFRASLPRTRSLLRQAQAMELGWKVQQLKRTLKSELRGKELGTQPRGSNSWIQVAAVRKPTGASLSTRPKPNSKRGS